MDTRLEQAIRTLRGIRQRYETESGACSGRSRFYQVQVALGYADMNWITATIEALEKVPTYDYELFDSPNGGDAALAEAVEWLSLAQGGPRHV
jgi:hypothetical protein